MFGTLAQVAVGDLSFDVWTDGPADGAPVMLLHGFPETALSWSFVAPLLTAKGLRVIAVNQRGYSPGARPIEVAAYSGAALVGDIAGLLDSLGLEAVHLVGHDWGAAVAWPFAVTHADRVRSLTAVSVPHLAAYGRALREDPDQQQRGAYIGLLRQPGKAEDVLLADDAAKLRAMYGGIVPADHVDEYVRLLATPGTLTAALNWYRAMTADLGELPAVTVPTTYVWSDDDMAIARAGAEDCARFVTGPYEFVELTGISHWIPEQAPQALAAAILKRIQSVA